MIKMKRKSKPLLGLRTQEKSLGSKQYRYTDDKKHEIIQDYLQSGRSKSDVWRFHTGQEQEHGQIIRWMRKLGYLSESNSSKSSNFLSSKKSTIMKTTHQKKRGTSEFEDLEKLQLERKIAALEKQLEEAQLKAIAFSTMVDIAEREFKIPIRKKYNTKPLKK